MVLGDADVRPRPRNWSRCRRSCERGHARRRGRASPPRCSTRPRPTPRPRSSSPSPAEAAKFGGIYATHMRSEGDADTPRPSTKPFASAAKRTSRSRSGTSRPPAKANWGRMPQIVAQIDAARAAGRRCQRRHLRLYRVVQHLLRFYPAMGARWRRRQADRAPQGSRHPRAHPQGHADAQPATGTTNGRRSPAPKRS